MPTNYRFIKNGKAAKLPDVDKEICKWHGQEGGKEYSQAYLFVTMSGIAILSRYDVIDEENINQFCDDAHAGQYKELLKEFLVKRYTFKTWWVER